MRKLMMGLLALLMMAAATPSFAAASGVLVVMNGNTEVNRETYNFLRRNLSQSGVSVSATQDTKSVKAGTYQAVLVLSTGVASGLDPVLKTFVDGYSAKNELFVVSLLKGSSSVTVQTAKLPAGNAQVDVVTAASKWSEGSDKMTYITLHQNWVTTFSAFVKAK